MSNGYLRQKEGSERRTPAIIADRMDFVYDMEYLDDEDGDEADDE